MDGRAVTCITTLLTNRHCHSWTKEKEIDKMLYSTQCFQFLIIRQQSPGSSRLIKEYLLRIWLKWLKKSSLQSALAFQRTPTEWMMLKCAQADCNIREHRFLHLMGTEIQ